MRKSDRDLLIIKNPISEYKIHDIMSKPFFFDMDGFQLSLLEQEYHKENNIELSNDLYHCFAGEQWIDIKDIIWPKFEIDHSFINYRYVYEGQALIQLENFIKEYKQLIKLLLLRKKWGLDFCLNLYDEFGYDEILHFELDYINYNDFVESKKYLEEKISKTNWKLFSNEVKRLINVKTSKSKRPADDLSDERAKMFGLKRAFFTLKNY